MTNVNNFNLITSPQIDWLTLRINYQDNLLQISPQYSYKVMDYTTPDFIRVIEITDINLGEVVATITDQPRSPVIPADLVLIKFHNKLLYTDNLKEYILNFCECNKMKILAISRLDICVDFQLFANRLNPEMFIKRFLSGKYVKRNTLTKYTAAGTYAPAKDSEIKNETFITHGNTGQRIRHEYLKFGTVNNGLKYYLYNKTKELQDKKFKPYIVERWKKYGYQESDPRPVWRLEFTVKSNDIRFIENTAGEPIKKGRGLIQEKLLIDRQTGESQTIKEFNVKSIECLDAETLEKIWQSLVNKYLIFFIGNNLKHKSRNKKLILFKNMTKYVAYTCEKSLKDSSNVDKQFVKNLRRTYEYTRTKDLVMTENLEQIIIDQIKRRGLFKWASEKDILNFSEDSIYNYKGDKINISQAAKLSESQKAKKFNKDSNKPPD